MLTEKFENNYTVLEDGQIQHQQVTVILRDDLEIARSNFRVVYNPVDGVPVSAPTRVKDIAGVVHTQDVIDDYRRDNPGRFPPVDPGPP